MQTSGDVYNLIAVIGILIMVLIVSLGYQIFGVLDQILDELKRQG